MISLTPIDVSAHEKLSFLRRLDRFRQWHSLGDKRQCLQCGQIITGREIEVVGGTRGLGPLRLQCPSENCPGLPIDWILPKGSARSLLGPAEKPAAEQPKENAPPAPDVDDRVAHHLAARKFFRRFKLARWGVAV
jgi:hypothetical protein